MKNQTLRASSIRPSSLVKVATAGLVAVLLAGCVVAPPRVYGPRVRVWVPFPIWFVPVAGYRHSEGSWAFGFKQRRHSGERILRV